MIKTTQKQNESRYTKTERWIKILPEKSFQTATSSCDCRIDTIVKFLKNDKKYKPLQATVMGCGGTGKSFIINTIMSIVRNITQMNDTIKMGAPSGAAAYNVQWST